MRFAGTQLSNFIGGTMNYSAIGAESQKGRGLERRAAMTGDAAIGNAGVESLGAVKAAEEGASAIVAKGRADGQASMFSGLSQGISGLAGGFSSRVTGGSDNSYYGTGSTDIDTPGKYGSFSTASVDRDISKYFGG